MEANMVMIRDFDRARLACGWSRLKAAQESNVSRGTIDKLVAGEPVRRLTAQKVLDAIERAGVDNIAQLEPVSGQGNVWQLPGTSRIESVAEINAAAVRCAKQLSECLIELRSRRLNNDAGFSDADFRELRIHCEDIALHFRQFAGLATGGRI